MELAFPILVIVGVTVVASEISFKKVVENPTSFGNRLQFLANSGKSDKLRELLMMLPDWPVRGLLVSAAENLGELWRGAAPAELAGVPTQTTQLIIQLVEQNEQTVWSIAVRIASLDRQSGISSLDMISEEAIQSLNRDMHVLTNMNQAVHETCQSLAVATTKGRGVPDAQHTMSVELQALAAKVRKLSGPF